MANIWDCTSPHEPALALLRRAVSNGIGLDVALRAPLQGVVADGGLQCLIDVSRIEEVVFPLRPVGPYPGETIGLQPDAHL